MYPFADVSTYSVETSSKESEKIQFYLTKKKLKLKSKVTKTPYRGKPEIDMNCLSSRKNE